MRDGVRQRWVNELTKSSDALAPWIETEEGREVQRKIWGELQERLEVIQPGVCVSL
jgi:hypothetical protein